jgi:hypothetical protein
MRRWVNCIVMVLVFCLHLPASVRAVPATLHFQGQVLNADGDPVAGPVDIEVGIWDRAAGGMLLFLEEHASTDLTNGIFSLLLGSNEPSVGSLDAGLFSGDDRWLELTIDGETLAPRQPFGSVPYALQAEEAERALEAERVEGIDASEIVSTSGATFTGPIDLVGGNGSANVRIGSTPGRPDHGSVSVADAAGNDLALLFVDESGFGKLAVRDSGGHELAGVGAQPVETEQRVTFVPQSGYVYVSGANGSANARMEMTPENPDYGRITVHDERSRIRGDVFVDETGSGLIELRDAEGTVRVRLIGSDGLILAMGPTGGLNASMSPGGSGGGRVSVFGADPFFSTATMSVDMAGAGEVVTKGPDGGETVRLSRSTGDANRGQVAVRDANSRKSKVIAEVDDQGKGVISVLDQGGSVRALVDGMGIVSVLGANGKTNASLIGLDDPAGGMAAVANADGQFRAAMLNSEAGGVAVVYNATGAQRGEMSVSEAGAGFMETLGPNGNPNTRLSSLGSNANHGFVAAQNASGNSVAALFADDAGRGGVQISDEEGYLSAAMRVNTAGNGFITTLGPGGSENVRLGSPVGSPDLGSISVANNLGETRGLMEVLPVGAGHITLQGPNGSDNVRLTALTQNANHGFVSVHDASGAAKAIMLVDPDGKGRIMADVKNFVVDHPNQPGKKIVYTALEGPEAGMYHRGVVPLTEGRATIELPEHFAALAVPETITVQLTPRSLDSLGVAVDSVDGDRIEIAELFDGAGSYDVHFLVQAVRRGFEDYEPVVTDEQFAEQYLGAATDGVSSGGAASSTTDAVPSETGERPRIMAEATKG